MTERRINHRWWLLALVGVLVVAAVAALVVWGRPVYEFLSDQEQIRAWVQGFGAWGPAVIILSETAQTILAPIPGTALEAASGYLFGPWLGALYAMAGITLGSTIIFLLVRRFGRPLVVHLVGKRSMARLDDLARRGGDLFFFLLWLLPFVPDDLACIAAGLTPMPTRRFLPLMILGRLPGIFVSVWIGANVTRIEPAWWIALFVVIAVAALALWCWGERLQDAVLNAVEKLSGRFDRERPS